MDGDAEAPRAPAAGSDAPARAAGVESRAKKRGAAAAAAGEAAEGRQNRSSAANGAGGRSPNKASKELSNGGGRRKPKIDYRKLLNIRQGGGATTTSPGAAGSTSPSGSKQSSRRSSTEAKPGQEDGGAASNNKKRRSGRVKAAAAAAAASTPPAPAVVVNGTTPGKKEASADSAEVDKEVAVVEPEKPAESKAGAAAAAAAATKGSVERVELMTGKRERKRKKFWDEEQPGVPLKVERDKISPPPTKQARRASDDKKGGGAAKEAVASSKAKASSSAAKPDQAAKRSERKVSGDKSKTSADGKKSPGTGALSQRQLYAQVKLPSGKQPSKLPYMQFDLSQPPEALAALMVEGENIPGPAQPIPVDSTMLPDGWEKRAVQRNVGVTKGKWDIFILSPSLKSFRSKQDLQRYLDENGTGLLAENFDFSLDNQLKRLRQIWKQYIVLPRRNSSAATAAAAAAVATAQQQSLQPPPTPSEPQSAASSAPNSIPASPAPGADASRSRLTSTGDYMGEDSLLDPLAESSASLVPEFAVESETGQGLRCTIANCGKLFRNDRLVSMHVKHYHRQFYDALMQRQKNVSDELHPESTETSPTSQAGAAATTATTAKPSEQPEHPPPTPTSSAGNSLAGKKRRRKESLGPSGERRSRLQQPAGDGPSNTTAAEEVGGRLSLFRRGPGRPARKSEAEGRDEDDDFNLSFRGGSGGRRSRNDSILSVGSETSSALATPNSVFADDGAAPTFPSKPSSSSAAPATPPTFRISKRRQAQLNKRKNLSPVLQVPKVEDTTDGKCYMEEFVSFLQSKSAAGGSAGGGGSAEDGVVNVGGGSASYPPSEMDASVVSEHLTSEEVVNCTCSRTEEDGLMIQCDICLCWQHGNCLGFEGDEQVPDKHVCKICRNPAKGRPSALYGLDQDWLKEGKLPTLQLGPSSSASAAPKQAAAAVPAASSSSSGTQREAAFKKLSELMADLANLSKVLHSVRVKLLVASQKNNPKVFMWSAPWEKEEEATVQAPPTPTPTPTPPQENVVVGNGGDGAAGQHLVPSEQMADVPADAAGTDTSAAAGREGAEGPNHRPDAPANEETAVAPEEGEKNEEAGKKQGSQQNGPSSILFPSLPDDEDAIGDGSESGKAKGAKQQDGKPEVVGKDEDEARTNGHCSEGEKEEKPAPANEGEEQQSESQGKTLPAPPPVVEDEGAMGDLDPSMIPSLSEVERLLPSVIQASMEGTLNPPPPPPPPPPQLPQAPKRIDKDECRWNLLMHIERVQQQIGATLDRVEAEVGQLEEEAGPPPPMATAQPLTAEKMASKTKAMVITLLQDLHSARKLLGHL